jgi:hypothetical protein
LLEWWVNQGASFTKKIKELSQPEKMKPLLLSLQNDTTNKNTISDVPSAPVEKGDEQAIQKLKNRGAVIMPVGAGSNYLEGNFITVNSIASFEKATGLAKAGGPTNQRLSPCNDWTMYETDQAAIGSYDYYGFRNELPCAA